MSARGLRWQLLAQAISMAGGALVPVALSLGLLQAGHSPQELALVLGAFTMPMVILAPIAGVWADRVDRKSLMVLCDVVRSACQLTFAFVLLSDRSTVSLLILLQAFAGAATTFHQSASVGLTASLAPAHRLQRANALLSMTRDVANTAGPLAAGVLVVTMGPGWAFLVDGIAFAGSAAVLSRIDVPARQARTREPILQEFREGLAEVLRRSWVWTSILNFGVSAVVFSMLMILGPAALLERPEGPLGWSLLVAALGSGQILGSLIAIRWQPSRPMLTGRLFELALLPLIFALLLDAPIGVLVVLALVAGTSFTFPDALWLTALQQHIPERSLSRVTSIDWLGSLMGRPVGFAISAVAASVGTVRALSVAAAVMSVTIVVTASIPGTWRIKRLTETLDPTPSGGAQ